MAYRHERAIKTLKHITKEVPCKKRKELPRNAAEPILALLSASKKWSRLPEDIENIVAKFMSRSTPSALALKQGLELSYNDSGYFSHLSHFVQRKLPGQTRTNIVWEIYGTTGKAISFQRWFDGDWEFKKERQEIEVYNFKTRKTYWLDDRSPYEQRRARKPHLLLADGRRMLI